jgi:hypothetical protein
MQTGSALLQEPEGKHVVLLLWDSVYPALHAKNDTCPVVPVADDTLPLPGAFKLGVHAFAVHGGATLLQLPDASH